MLIVYKGEDCLKKKTLVEIFPNKIPENITHISGDFGFLNELINNFYIGFNFPYLFKNNYQWKNECSFFLRLNPLNLLLTFISKTEKQKLLYKKEQMINAFYGSLFQNLNQLILNNFKIIVYKKKIKILENIIEKIEKNQNYRRTHQILYLKSTLFNIQNKLNITKIQKLKNQECLDFFKVNSNISQFMFFNHNLEESFICSMEKSLYIKMQKSLKLYEIINQFNLNLELNHKLFNKNQNPSNISLFLSFKSSNLPKKYQNLIQDFQNKNIENFKIINQEILMLKNYLYDIFNILISNINILLSNYNINHLGHENFIESLKSVFNQLDEILYSLEILISKQKGLIELIGFKYLKKIEVEEYSVEKFQILFNSLNFENIT